MSNTELKQKSRFYIAGYCDGKNNAKVQGGKQTANMNEEYKEYLNGYADAKEEL